MAQNLSVIAKMDKRRQIRVRGRRDQHPPDLTAVDSVDVGRQQPAARTKCLRQRAQIGPGDARAPRLL